MSSTSEKQTCSVPQATPEAIDASCRWPVLILFTGGAGWLALSTLLGFLATMKFHMPGLFAKCPFFSYGRLVASSNSLLIYGFGISVALGMALWMTARIGKTRLVGGLGAVIGAHFWHAGVLVMWITLALGGLTGHEWFEVPKTSALVLFASFVAIAVPVILTLVNRADCRLQPSQWFILAAVLWFAWIFATTCVLVHCHPARGVVQAAVQYWYGHNLIWIVFGFFVLAAVFHFYPQYAGGDLYSRELAAFTFWTMLVVGSVGGVPHGVPLPAWLSSIGAVSAVLMLIPLGAAFYNCNKTLPNPIGKLFEDPSKTLVATGSTMLFVSALAAAIGGVRPLTDMVGLTTFDAGVTTLVLQGVVGLTLMGAILHIAPKVAGQALPSSAAVKAQVGASMLGAILVAAFLIGGGILVGFNSLKPAAAVENEALIRLTKVFIQGSSIGTLLLLAGHFALLVNLKWLCFKLCRSCCPFTCESAQAGKPAEVTA